MPRLTAYRNTERHCFCQIRFESGERVLVSVAGVPEPGIKVVKLLFRFFPRTIWEFSAAGEKDAHNEMIDMFSDPGSPGAGHPLDAVILKLRPCKSCGQALRALRQAEVRFRSSENSAAGKSRDTDSHGRVSTGRP